MDEATPAVATRLNHVGMSMAMDDLDRLDGDVLAFYGEVFGWSGYRDREADGSPLILLLGDGAQFVFVYGETGTTGARPMDHYGVVVDTEDDLDRILRRARHAQARDPRVTIVDKAVTTAGEVEVVHCYVEFVLPLAVEVQFFRRSSTSP